MSFAPALARAITPTLNILDSYSSYLQADVTMTNANQFYDGPSLVLGKSGKYLILGSVLVFLNTNANVTAKFWDGTTAYSAAGGPGGIGGNYIQIPLYALVTPAALPTTYKISVAGNNANNIIKATPVLLSPGNLVSYLLAVRLGP